VANLGQISIALMYRVIFYVFMIAWGGGVPFPWNRRCITDCTRSSHILGQLNPFRDLVQFKILCFRVYGYSSPPLSVLRSYEGFRISITFRSMFLFC
jgi:hypothetical protein